MEVYIDSKEHRKWKPDIDGDKVIDFYEAWAPIFVFISFYILKILCCRVEYGMIKFLMCLSVIGFAYLGESHFDRSENNDAPIWLQAIPITIFLFG